MSFFRHRRHPILFRALVWFVIASATCLNASEIIRLTSENYDQVAPRGKEVDAIYGDWVIRNEHIVAVIAQPVPGRKANMTVRGVAGMLIDLTTRRSGSDQLSCFYPTGGRYLFEKLQEAECQIDEQTAQPLQEVDKATGNTVRLTFSGVPVADDGTRAEISYVLKDDSPWIEYAVVLQNASEQAKALTIEDSIRCDGNLFKTGILENGAFFAEDQYFGQAYAISVEGQQLQKQGGRNMQLVPAGKNQPAEISSGESLAWRGKVLCSQGMPGIRSLLRLADEGTDIQSTSLLLQCPLGPIPHAVVEFFQDGKSLGTMLTTDDGFVRTKLSPGSYIARIEAEGHVAREHRFEVEQNSRSDTLSFEAPSRVRARITNAQGLPIAAKVQFIGLDGTPDPDFGPDSAISAIKNVVYSAHGTFEQPLDPGRYRVIISHGPEFDASTREIELEAGQVAQVTSALPRVVDTTGWISAEFHSHSTPSGDNVSHQTGRVLNLLAEHLEFAPCTEHNRIDTYADDLELLAATSAMATCTGMELTGGPLPINHQNAFPLKMHVHEQDGGAPLTDADPVKQIERLALWDNGSSKVVQSNHPNIPSILGDRDLDGIPDEGFRGMLGWMDVIEVHPPEKIFEFPEADIAADEKRTNPIFFWLQLLNLGYRIPGVVNTDAHYNFHGSGWLRTYLKSSTDEPASIAIEEMIHSSEHGHAIMTTGPFLEFEVRTGQADERKTFIAGDDVRLTETSGKMWIRVQCPNWFDINRVQVFANGRPLENANYTRRTHPELFSGDVVRFELESDLPKLKEDTHLIVATIGEGLKLGPVMGPTSGELPPVAVTNPIFVDLDGGGFQPNGDDLGVPFMIDDRSSAP